MPQSVLLVEDDALMRSFLATVLKEDGYRVIEAGNGREGLEKLSDGEFDLVITDLRMPELSGLDLMKEGREGKTGDPLDHHHRLSVRSATPWRP